jgi:Zn-dependent peptidase ImmA (M78 family)/plasmid maintenance system antidote protein VapI
MNQEINRRMIVLAREARGLTQQELAEKIKLHKANVSRLENGDTKIHRETIMAISAATCFPPQFFTQQGNFIPVNLAYRKREKVHLKLLSPIEAQMNIIRRHAQLVTRALNKLVPRLPAFEVTEERPPSMIAELVRKKWNIGSGAIENMVAVFESYGIIISSFDFRTDRVDSRSMFTDDKYPIIFLNRGLLGDRLRYSLAYELGQLIMHTHTVIPSERNVTNEANEFAAAFLMPKEDILKDFEGGLTLTLLAKLKMKWKTSMISLLYRADDLGLITANQKRYLIQQFNEQNIRRREPIELDVPKENATLFKKLIKQYIYEYEISIVQMADIFAICLEDFFDYYGEM